MQPEIRTSSPAGSAASESAGAAASRLPAGWQAMIDAMQEAVWLVDERDLRIVGANVAAGVLAGGPARQFIGQPVSHFAASPEDACFWDEVRSGDTEGLQSDTLVLCGQVGVPVTRRVSRVGFGGAGEPGGYWIVSLQDRRAHLHTQRELECATSDLRATLESVHDGLLVTDLSGRIRNFNRRFAALWALPQALSAHRDDDAVLEWMRRAVADPPAYMRRLAALDDDATCGEAVDTVRLRCGKVLERITRPQLDHGRLIGRVVAFRDITASMDAQHRVQALAYTDALTGLPNRRLLRDRIEQALAVTRRDRSGFALLVVNLDQFARLNDTLGRLQTDGVLLEVAERLTTCMRQVDTVARVGGDEFVVLAQRADRSGAEGVALRVVAALSRPFSGGENACDVGASIGVALCPGEAGAAAGDVDELLRRADAAMSEAKAAGRGGICFWREPEASARTAEPA